MRQSEKKILKQDLILVLCVIVLGALACVWLLVNKTR